MKQYLNICQYVRCYSRVWSHGFSLVQSPLGEKCLSCHHFLPSVIQLYLCVVLCCAVLFHFCSCPAELVIVCGVFFFHHHDVTVYSNLFNNESLPTHHTSKSFTSIPYPTIKQTMQRKGNRRAILNIEYLYALHALHKWKKYRIQNTERWLNSMSFTTVQYTSIKYQ